MKRNDLVVTPTNTALAAFFAVLLFIGGAGTVLAADTLLDPSSIGFGGESRTANYDELVDAFYASGRTTSSIPTAEGNALWVPWFSSSSMCTEAQLHKGSACNAGTIDFEHNCMVSDELSQVGLIVSMGNNQPRMDEYYNTLLNIKSTNGAIPAWRVYRDGNTIESCKPGINGNCDTASDATARMIISLYTAAANDRFLDAAKKAKYRELADQLSKDFLTYEVLQQCKPSTLGEGDICYWLAAGSEAKRGGMGVTDFGYTGYYPDAITAMLQACSNTGDAKYCAVAGNFTLNYLQAAKYDGRTFSTPPGRSFRWIDSNGIPTAQCTNTCNPVQWDSADAPRAVAICEANYYADAIGYELPLLQEYCNLWNQEHMSNPENAPIQYTPDGTAVRSENSYFAQGLQALFQAGTDTTLFRPSLDSALRHYSTTTRTFDWTACFGIYHQAFPMRALGTGIGLNSEAFPPLRPACTPSAEVCDGKDNNCNSQADEGGVCTVWYRDADTDGYGDQASTTKGASQPTGYTSNKLDCNDGNRAVNPAAAEVCDGTDNNCNGQTDENNVCAPTCTPATETCDQKDNDCDGQVDENDVCGSSQTCHNSVRDIPASCKGGTITSDSGSGCRTIICSGSGASMKVMACDKTGYFEMYKQEQTGTAVSEICIGETCISSNGFARSVNYPICTAAPPACTPSTEVCDGKDNDCDSQTDENNVCAPACTPSAESCNSKDDDCDGQVDENDVCGSSQTCYNSIKDMPMTCAGSVTEDSFSGGCRTVVCSGAAGESKVLACDKGAYFEIYRQGGSGTPQKICFGSTCIESAGFARSDSFPICTGTAKEDVQPGVRVTASQLSSTSFSFTCAPTGFSPTAYEWQFGDGKTGSGTSSISHKYAAYGTYQVQCFAKSGNVQVSNSTTVRVGTVSTQTCANSVKDMPVRCEGGTVTKDLTVGGCRTVVCTAGSASMQAMACEKGGRFELYKQAQTGTIVKSICLGSNCVGANGFVASPAYPICG